MVHDGSTSDAARHEHYMRRCLSLAHEALVAGEVPVGALVMHGHRVVGEGRESTARLRDASAHAEMMAIRVACRTLDAHRLRAPDERICGATPQPRPVTRLVARPCSQGESAAAGIPPPLRVFDGRAWRRDPATQPFAHSVRPIAPACTSRSMSAPL
jgi:pyrimidine deaminase RibD-like protein